MNDAEREVRRLARCYPTLFGTDGNARTKALVQMYLCSGGGYEWAGGRLLPIEVLRGLEPRRRPRARADFDGSEADRQAVRDENDHVPHFPSHFDGTLCPLAELPPDARPSYRAQAAEVLAYFLDASMWHFVRYDGGARAVFSPQQEWDAKAALRALRDRLGDRLKCRPRRSGRSGGRASSARRG